jgi:hypothetical protein
VVCLLGGTYNLASPIYLSKGGTAAAYVTYKSYDTANPALLVWASSANDPMLQVNNNAAYITVQGLKFNGKNISNAGIRCSPGSHHLRMLGNTINNAGSGGISSTGCDYLTIDGNRIHHTGYNTGWSSGISLNSHIWYDQAAGFHSFVVNNIVAGTYDNSYHHSDGNGIIMDRGEATPPVLIANNLVYMNGGRCIHIYRNQNKWVVNNTCYSSSLDGQLNSGAGSVPEYSALYATNVYFVNNVVKAWIKGYPFKQYQSTNIKYFRNVYTGGKGLSGVSSTSASDPQQLRQANPLFVNPIALDPTADGQYRNALHPDQIGTRFQLQSSSSLINAGIDPRTIPGLTTELKAGIEKYLMRDLNGTPRPQGSGFDIGAYESAAP